MKKVMIRSQKGFSLVELIIAIAILGILAAVSISMFSGMIQRTRLKTDMETASQIKKAITTYIAETGDDKLEMLSDAITGEGESSTAGGSAASGVTPQLLTQALSYRLTLTDKNNKEIKVGPYLEAKLIDTTGSPEVWADINPDGYQPQANVNKGWLIDIFSESGVIVVNPDTLATGVGDVKLDDDGTGLASISS